VFLKINKSKGKEYLKIVESYWDKNDKKVKHRVLVNLGRLDTLLQHSSLIERLIDKLSNGEYVKIDEINKDGEALNFNYGYIVLRDIWRRYKLDSFFKRILEDKKIISNNSDTVIKTIFSLIVNRALFSEYSKKGYFDKKDYFLFLNEEIKLHNLYLTLETLTKIKEEIEIHLLNINKTIFDTNLQISLFDVTTLYFVLTSLRGCR